MNAVNSGPDTGPNFGRPATGLSAACRAIADIMWADVDSDLSTEQADRVAAHFGECAACRLAAGARDEIDAALRVTPGEMPATHEWRRLDRELYGAIARGGAAGRTSPSEGLTKTWSPEPLRPSLRRSGWLGGLAAMFLLGVSILIVMQNTGVFGPAADRAATEWVEVLESPENAGPPMVLLPENENGAVIVYLVSN